ncbi:MAG: hypothetical protein EOO03_14735 [Chitinophagaceae bacterium]|nr:MAG: hypothetical protein EOO03_14735 [Chitinophagaceae bacterium]
MLTSKKYFRASYHQPYPSVPWLLPFLIVTVHFLIIFEEKPSFITIMSNWGYYRALLFSWAVSLLSVYWVRRKSIGLDASFPWRSYFSKRFAQQLKWGIILPTVLTLCLATAYFAFLKVNIMHTVYFSRYIPMMAVLLTLLNVLAFGWNQYFIRIEYTPNRQAIANIQWERHVHNDDIACVYAHHDACHYRNRSGDYFLWTGTIEEAALLLGPSFFLIRRGVLIERNAIINILAEGELLKVVLAFEVPVSLIVSHRQLAEFKRWLAQE